MENPYSYDGPILGRRGFYNRVSEITRLVSRIAADQPQSVSIVGPCQSGKTSLLNWLGDPESQREYLQDIAPYLFVYIDGAAVASGGPQDFFGELSRRLEAGGQVTMAPSQDGFGELAQRLLADRRKLVLFLDDFGQITRSTEFSLDFFSFLRAMANSHDVGYVTTSMAPLQRLCHSQYIEESPFFNIFTTINLTPFAQEHRQALVEDAAAAVGAPFSAEEAGLILELGGDWPYLLQMTADLAFAMRDQDALTAEVLVEQAGKKAKGHLTGLWDGHFSDPEKSVLSAVGAGKAVQKQLLYAAESLQRRGHVWQADGRYAIKSKLLEAFVKEQGGFFKRIFG